MEAESAVAALFPRVGEIAATMIARCAEEIPEYRLLPASVMEGDLVANGMAVFELFLTTVAEGRTPTEEELALPIAWGAERARDGLPLAAVLKIYPVAAQEAWRLVVEILDAPDLLALVGHLLSFLAEVMPRVAAAYLREREDLDWEQREHRQNLAGSLLAGRPAQRAAERYGRTLAERYDVVVFHLPAAPADTSTRVTTDLFRAIQADLDSRPEVLATFKGDGGVLLVPTAGSDSRSHVAQLLTRIDKASHVRCTAAAATANGHAGIPDAHNEAADVLTLAEQLGRPPGVYWLADLAIEYQLAQPSPARAALAATLSPLESHPHLIDALRSFVANGYNRGEAATALSIHRNTLTYRLSRIQLLTGYDATRPADARRLTAAMTAHDVIRALK
ncbi:MAG: hypothetical protein JWQ81_5982 [Amycolatopsis sp.]|uniref:PucR family transcriptional regulator n=1 Tax=Amycolatopsis sp. TaxID=37632 RepID=UPI00263951E3|nr:helix-turn-helix domain-containing protein [Amycolatopsis sp.]MCU1685243.1 hypothetical protein [Amycolatopsis sp.]